MIKDTELRKGNLLVLSVNWKDNIHRIDEIYTDEVKVTSIEDGGCFPRMKMGSCNPIPLTPDWLERCGFEKVKEEDSNSYLSYSILKLDDIIAKQKDGWHQMITDVDGYHEQNIGVKLEFVHQLQNRYQSLTGEELEIKL
jgi:hypothetical protein